MHPSHRNRQKLRPQPVVSSIVPGTIHHLVTTSFFPPFLSLFLQLSFLITTSSPTVAFSAHSFLTSSCDLIHRRLFFLPLCMECLYASRLERIALIYFRPACCGGISRRLDLCKPSCPPCSFRPHSCSPEAPKVPAARHKSHTLGLLLQPNITLSARPAPGLATTSCSTRRSRQTTTPSPPSPLPYCSYRPHSFLKSERITVYPTWIPATWRSRSTPLSVSCMAYLTRSVLPTMTASVEKPR